MASNPLNTIYDILIIFPAKFVKISWDSFYKLKPLSNPFGGAFCVDFSSQGQYGSRSNSSGGSLITYFSPRVVKILHVFNNPLETLKPLF